MSNASLDPSDPAYPAGLSSLLPTPPVLRIRGALPRAAGVAVVGTRQASKEGVLFARELGAAVASAGFVVWSGGATGIDQAAHEGALSVGGVTVLVGGGGLEKPYPPGSEQLHADVAQRGAVLGIVPDDAPPQPWIFHARNGLLAAATRATVVVECPLRSGTRNTTAHARRLGRPVLIFAQPPWSPFALAVREEVRLGARILLTIDDLLADLTLGSDALPVVLAAPRKKARGVESTPPRGATSPDVSGDEKVLLDALASTSLHPDELVEVLGWHAARVQRSLLALLLLGEVTEAEGGTYVPTNPRKET